MLVVQMSGAGSKLKSLAKDVGKAAAKGAVGAAGAAIRSKLPKSKAPPLEPARAASNVLPWVIGGGVAIVVGMMLFRGRR